MPASASSFPVLLLTNFYASLCELSAKSMQVLMILWHLSWEMSSPFGSIHPVPMLTIDFNFVPGQRDSASLTTSVMGLFRCNAPSTKVAPPVAPPDNRVGSKNNGAADVARAASQIQQDS